MKKISEKKIRILQVVGGMDAAGTETWLMHVLRNINRNKYSIDFLVHSPRAFFYSNEIAALGSKIIICDKPFNIFNYYLKLKKILRKEKYDIVHSHLQYYNGLVMRAASVEGVQVRIAHSHSDTRTEETTSNVFKKLYFFIMKKLIHKYMTKGLAVSEKAASSLFGLEAVTNPSIEVLYCGIDLSEYKLSVNKNKIREELGISESDCVIGHVGRFAEVKNHKFLIDIFKKLQKSNYKLLLIGDGPLRREIEEKIEKEKLEDFVIMTGIRDDIPRLLKGAIDIFVLPSLFEGLPLVGIEVQAAGIPFVLSDNITEEMDIVSSLITRVPVNSNIDQWVQSIHLASKRKKGLETKAFKLMSNSKFEINRCVGHLTHHYTIN